ncbi:hypothetical protein Goshw_021986 [Gossypium schwendimanii]|uniref:CCHC-type domain-containing protein n=1 Tax=Gossypium schwendimanii TaxID=34291 RepID=A0A7J9NDH1_GOSSC|nr:hypothetical protein [Gossypium schwendimanii]
MEDFIVDLSLEDDDEETIQLGVESSECETSYANYFLGMFLTSSVVNFQVMRSTLANVWHLIEGVSISDLGNERFLVRFYIEVDVDRVEKNGSWNFNSYLLVLHWLKEGEYPLSVQLNWVDFWMIIHDLPLGFMSKAIAKQLGSFIGAFLEYDTSTTQLGYKRIIRINVRIDVRKSLKRKKNLTLSNGKPIYVRFKYEKLTLFCFFCGKIGHGESFCLIRAHNPWQEYVFHWDIYLRAQSMKILA